ncbi:MAG: hypothetical protein IKK18_04635 [Clostridia bacterium]|nr:hypothetical protein [Clostridia bacterium]
MSVIYSFMDNSLYGADDINQTFSKLTTQGVSLFNYTDGDNPLISLNDAVSGLTYPGIELYNVNACKVVYDKENDKFSVFPGNAFMIDGSTITIDSDEYDITEQVLEQRKSSNGDIWVCFNRNIPKNSIDISVSADDSVFNSQYAVPLAKISSNNTVVDMRKFAKTKLAPCSANVISEYTMSFGTLTYKETGYERRRTILKDAFPGASKVFINGVVRDIQRVDIEAGESLTYERAWYKTVASDILVAFNMTGEGLEVWAYQPYNSAPANDWHMIVF